MQLVAVYNMIICYLQAHCRYISDTDIETSLIELIEKMNSTLQNKSIIHVVFFYLKNDGKFFFYGRGMRLLL